MIDVRPILTLLDLNGRYEGPAANRGLVHGSKLEDAIVEIVRAANAELERITRAMFERFGRDWTEQDLAAVLARPVEIDARDDCGLSGCPERRL